MIFKRTIQILFLPILFLFCGTLVIACNEEEPETPYEGVCLAPQSEWLADYEDLYTIANYHAIVQQCQGISLQGKSIAYFGGSLATLPESDIAKAVVAQHLCNPVIMSYGRGEYGFSSQMGSVQDFVDHAQPHDIFILWCSTNDYTGSMPMGEPTDYTELDGFDESKRNTQCGGINYCIRRLREVNPQALIVGFTSLKFFGLNKQETDGYMENSPRRNKTGHSFIDYVDKQIECFQFNGIPYLDQWRLDVFTEDNYAPYYKTDGYHLEKSGYFLIGVKHLEFLGKLLKSNH